MQQGAIELAQTAREKFRRFRELSTQMGEDAAWEAMLEGFPKLQKQRMGPLLALPTLADAFRAAIPIFETVGMTMQAVDISNQKTDAALEIQHICPWLGISREFGYDTPCRVICEMDMEASHRAFPELKGEILCRQAFGCTVCIFKYERPQKNPQ